MMEEELLDDQMCESQELEEFENLLKDNEMDEEIQEETETKVVTVITNSSDKQFLIDKETKEQLYECLGIPSEHLERNFGEWRLEVVHIRGVQDMSTEDVLSYFSQHDPSSIEWVNDLSCNVVFDNEDMAAKALLDLSTSFVIKGENISDIDFPSDIEVIDGNSIKVSIPVGRWKLGLPNEKADILLLRLANFNDRKVKGAYKFSQYYFKYGYNQNEKNEEKIPTKDSDINNVNEEQEDLILPSKRSEKFFRMRMRADDEENENRLKSNKGIKIRLENSEREVIDFGKSRSSIWDRLDTRVIRHKRGDIWNRLDKPADDLRSKINKMRARRGAPY